MEVVIFLGVYFLPTVIAAVRGHKSAWGIFALNLLLGWTVLCWLWALIWSMSNTGQSVTQTVVVNNNQAAQPPAPQAQPIYIQVPTPAPPALPSVSAQPLVQQGQMPLLPPNADTKEAAIKCRFCGEPQNRILIEYMPDKPNG
jgi:Superinfection immunity protein